MNKKKMRAARTHRFTSYNVGPSGYKQELVWSSISLNCHRVRVNFVKWPLRVSTGWFMVFIRVRIKCPHELLINLIKDLPALNERCSCARIHNRGTPHPYPPRNIFHNTITIMSHWAPWPPSQIKSNSATCVIVCLFVSCNGVIKMRKLRILFRAVATPHNGRFCDGFKQYQLTLAIIIAVSISCFIKQHTRGDICLSNDLQSTVVKMVLHAVRHSTWFDLIASIRYTTVLSNQLLTNWHSMSRMQIILPAASRKD